MPLTCNSATGVTRQRIPAEQWSRRSAKNNRQRSTVNRERAARAMRCSLPCLTLLAGASVARGFVFPCIPCSCSWLQQARCNGRRGSVGAQLMAAKSGRHRDNRQAHRVVLVRHGQSTWNRDGRYIGWTGEGLMRAIKRVPAELGAAVPMAHIV